MKFTSFSAILAVFAAVSSAAPTVEKRVATGVTFHGAGGAYFVQAFIEDGTENLINMHSPVLLQEKSTSY